jgi:hypothetical protein
MDDFRRLMTCPTFPACSKRFVSPPKQHAWLARSGMPGAHRDCAQYVSTSVCETPAGFAPCAPRGRHHPHLDGSAMSRRLDGSFLGGMVVHILLPSSLVPQINALTPTRTGQRASRYLSRMVTEERDIITRGRKRNIDDIHRDLLDCGFATNSVTG